MTHRIDQSCVFGRKGHIPMGHLSVRLHVLHFTNASGLLPCNTSMLKRQHRTLAEFEQNKRKVKYKTQHSAQNTELSSFWTTSVRQAMCCCANSVNITSTGKTTWALKPAAHAVWQQKMTVKGKNRNSNKLKLEKKQNLGKIVWKRAKNSWIHTVLPQCPSCTINQVKSSEVFSASRCFPSTDDPLMK